MIIFYDVCAYVYSSRVDTLLLRTFFVLDVKSFHKNSSSLTKNTRRAKTKRMRGRLSEDEEDKDKRRKRRR
jgi:hypothetical protein